MEGDQHNVFLVYNFHISLFGKRLWTLKSVIHCWLAIMNTSKRSSN